MTKLTDMFNEMQNDYVGIDAYDDLVQVSGTFNEDGIDLALTSGEARALAANLIHYAGELEAGRI